MAETRVEHWKRKLLDLSLRNPLLNARNCKKFLPLNEGTPYADGAATTVVVPKPERVLLDAHRRSFVV